MGGGIARGLAHLAHNSVHVKNVFKFMDAKRENGTGTERVAQRESFTNLNMERCVRSMHARTNTHARTLARPHEHTKKKTTPDGRITVLFYFIFFCVCVCAGNIAYSAPDLQSVCVCACDARSSLVRRNFCMRHAGNFICVSNRAHCMGVNVLHVILFVGLVSRYNKLCTSARTAYVARTARHRATKSRALHMRPRARTPRQRTTTTVFI